MKTWYVAAVFISVICGWFFAWGCGELYESAHGYTWPHVNGKVISSVARSAQMKGRRGEFMSYWPEVRYEYEVNNVRFIGNRVRFTERGMDEEETRKVVAAYPRGTTVTVWFSPSNAKASVLERGIFWPLVPVLLIAFSLSASIAAFLYTQFKRGSHEA